MSKLGLPPEDSKIPDGCSAVSGETALVRVPAVGELAYDSRGDRVGVVMEVKAAYALLRPPGGGCEWDVPLGYLYAADQADRLRARVAERNAASRWGL